MDPQASAPLIAHVIHRLDIGGLENGVVNLINHLPADRFRHAVVCLTGATRFRERIRDPEVVIHELHKREGNDLSIHPRLWRLFRRLRPAVVHTRNIATLEAQLPALLAGVPVRIHGEHGRDIYDVDGSNRKYRILRRVMAPLVHCWAPMSRDLEDWLRRDVGIAASRIRQLYSGVDVSRFAGTDADLAGTPLERWREEDAIVFGSVGRMEPIKDPLTLARAFARMVESVPGPLRTRLRLAMVGGGALKPEVEALLAEHGLLQDCWLPGPRDDVPRLLGGLDVFVLPSLGEGISNTILEAMACARPVVATAVGGNPELVTEDTGILVPAGNPGLLTDALCRYAVDLDLRRRHGQAGRARALAEFSLEAMVGRYQDLYRSLLNGSK